MIAGVYKITHISSSRVYVGSSRNIKQRWSAHRSALRSGSHANSYLQNAWDKYGEEDFSFEVLEETASLIEQERAWVENLNSCDRDSGFNLMLPFRSPWHETASGEKNRHAKLSLKKVAAIRSIYLAKELTVLDLAKEYSVSSSAIRRILQGISWADPNYSPEEAIQKMRSDHRVSSAGAKSAVSRLTWSQVDFIRNNYTRKKSRHDQVEGYTQSQLADMFSVDKSTISNVIRNKVWKPENHPAYHL